MRAGDGMGSTRAAPGPAPGGRAVEEGAAPEWIEKFERDLAVDVAFERSILRRELWIVAAILVLIVIREVLL